MTTAYDKADWHDDGGAAAGQPVDRAFTHIGLYLAWLIRHDLHNPDFIRSDWAAAIKAGEMTGSDLSGAVDGVLVSDMMDAEGRAFSDAYYPTYLEDYDATFAEYPDYGVPDDEASYRRIAAVIDARYQAWVEQGRPARPVAEHEEAPVLPLGRPAVAGTQPVSDEDLRRFEGQMRELASQSGWVIEEPPGANQMPHLAPDLEALIPSGLADPPMTTSSVTGAQWGDSLLSRALRRLGVEPRHAVVANGIGGTGPGTVTVTLYSVPGIDAARLDAELSAAIHLPPKGRWTERDIAGRQVNWADGEEFAVGFWALDGLVVHVAGSRGSQLENVIAQLPGATP